MNWIPIKLIGFEPGQVQAERIRKEDVKKIADDRYEVTYRFTVLTEVDKNGCN